MRSEYDFSEAKKNPYAKQLKEQDSIRRPFSDEAQAEEVSRYVSTGS